jgi:hypothetical protein
MYFPMLAHPWDKGHKRLVYPLYGQPKLDGARCLCYLKAPDTGPEQVVIYTRTLKLWPSMEYLQEVLYPYLNDLYDREAGQSIYLDGELYRHGVSLQEISGVSRNGKRREFSELNQYHIYDCFYPHEMSTPFSARLKQLRVLGKAIKDSDPLEGVTNIPDGTHPSKIVHIVPTVKVKDYKDGCKKFQAYIAKGSRGKDKGAILWVLQTKSGKRFNVTPKDMTYKERYALYQKASKHFATKYEGRMMTVEYEDLSKDDVPLRAKSVGFRDYE